jgi:hypothetical protein
VFQRAVYVVGLIFCPLQFEGAKPRRVKWPKVLLWLQRGLVILAVSLALIYRNPSFVI